MIVNLFNFDQLAAFATVLIFIISVIVAMYSKRYFRGDAKRQRFFWMIGGITLSLMTTFSADHIVLFGAAWTVSNMMLVLMMIHKQSWKQAVASGTMALKNFAIGSTSLAIALAILHFETGSYSIKEILSYETISQKAIITASVLIFITALTQSALYPFHRWLTSSLNSPTPVSAIMHAGLVNGGGIILARFAPLFVQMPNMMTVIFVIGMVSAIVGSVFKLVQSNVKSMLACSTMSQMGFMVAQCGMGLFPAAIAHLFWHGMFKSYLFLSSPGSWQEKRVDLHYPPKLSSFVVSLICGVLGAFIFAQINGMVFAQWNTMWILVVVAFIAASQVALTIIDRFPVKNIVPALVISSVLSAIYGCSVMLIECMMSTDIFHPQDINMYHILATVALFIFWLARLFSGGKGKEAHSLLLKGYVKALNASQPDAKTITSHRNQYNYR